MLIFQGVKGFRENHHHFYSGFFFRLQWWIAGFQVCRLKHLWIFSLWFGDKKYYFLQKSTTWAEILNTKKCPHPLKLRWIPQKMMGRLENLYMFSGFKLWQQSRYILGIYFRGKIHMSRRLTRWNLSFRPGGGRARATSWAKLPTLCG